ncbi:MAG: hypothetical protein WA709_30450 [Stellaceae bacterium]
MKLGLEQSLGTRLVTYADDLVILCRRGNAEKALHHLREIMGELKLTHRTGHADLPHPALGQDFTPSPTTGRGWRRSRS